MQGLGLHLFLVGIFVIAVGLRGAFASSPVDWEKAGFKNPVIETLSGADLHPKLDSSRFTHQLKLTAVIFRDAGWTSSQVKARLGRVATVYQQCGIEISGAELVLVDSPSGSAIVDEPTRTDGVGITADLAARTPEIERPILYYVGPSQSGSYAFSERVSSVGSGNPLANTVWITNLAARESFDKIHDPSFSVDAHELTHVVANCGHVSDGSRNLMSDDFTLDDGSLTPAQCATMRQSPLVSPIAVTPSGTLPVTTERDFNQVITSVVSQFSPAISSEGATLNVVKLWHSDVIAANGGQDGSHWAITFHGELARADGMTRDAFALIVCHELGHHLAGYPFFDSGKALGKESSEPEADYFATEVCARRIWKDATDENSRYRALIDPLPQSQCDGVWESSSDRDTCYRTLVAAKALGLSASLRDFQPVPSFDKLDPTAVEKTEETYGIGQLQCMFDTLVAGALCKAEAPIGLIPGIKNPAGYNSLEAEAEASRYSCMKSSGFKIGLRPACWFREQSEGRR